jgi:acetate kinase
MILVIDHNLKEIKYSCFPDPMGAVAFRVLFGGDLFKGPVFIDEVFLKRFAKLTPLFPLYVPPMLDLLKTFRKVFKDVPLVAFFETSFFSDLPDEGKYYALPYEYLKANSIRRWGFHGTLHEANIEDFPAKARNISIVLDKQTTVCAVTGKKPLSISLGYTPLEGIMSRTACGDLDPGIVFYLMNEHNFSLYKIDEMLKSKGGFFGITGYDISLNELIKLRGKDRKAGLAFDIFRTQVLKHIGQGISLLDGLDNLVFSGSLTGPFGPVIHDIVKKLSFLGINTVGLPWGEDKGMTRISSNGSGVKVFINRISPSEIIFHKARAFLTARS